MQHGPVRVRCIDTTRQCDIPGPPASSSKGHQNTLDLADAMRQLRRCTTAAAPVAVAAAVYLTLWTPCSSDANPAR